MNTTIKEQNGELVALFEGRLDTAAAPQTEKDLAPLANCDGKNIVLDCSALEYISSSGLRLFLSVLKNAKPKGSHVYITGMNNDIRNIFTMTGFTNLFEFR
ncbi:MAG: STAS domain-containing protein [Bacteroidales bacterium]|nr:STAS domain-containing protein [Bacteroidales bacterium]